MKLCGIWGVRLLDFRLRGLGFLSAPEISPKAETVFWDEIEGSWESRQSTPTAAVAGAANGAAWHVLVEEGGPRSATTREAVMYVGLSSARSQSALLFDCSGAWCRIVGDTAG